MASFVDYCDSCIFLTRKLRVEIHAYINKLCFTSAFRVAHNKRTSLSQEEKEINKSTNEKITEIIKEYRLTRYKENSNSLLP